MRYELVVVRLVPEMAFERPENKILNQERIIDGDLLDVIVFVPRETCFIEESDRGHREKEGRKGRSDLTTGRPASAQEEKYPIWRYPYTLWPLYKGAPINGYPIWEYPCISVPLHA